MDAKTKHRIKEQIRKSKWATQKEKGKKHLTSQELKDILNLTMHIVKITKPVKSNWMGKTEPEKIQNILKNIIGEQC